MENILVYFSGPLPLLFRSITALSMKLPNKYLKSTATDISKPKCLEPSARQIGGNHQYPKHYV